MIAPEHDYEVLQTGMIIAFYNIFNLRVDFKYKKKSRSLLTSFATSAFFLLNTLFSASYEQGNGITNL